MKSIELNGWNQIIYELIKSNFKYNVFSSNDIYEFKEDFSKAYPQNNHIKDKIRQILQQLRDLDLLIFLGNATYQLIRTTSVINETESDSNNNTFDYLYIISNESIPGWIKIGRTSSLEKQLSLINNNSIPIDYELSEFIKTTSLEQSKSIALTMDNLIRTFYENDREVIKTKDSFYNISIEHGLLIFSLLKKITNL